MIDTKFPICNFLNANFKIEISMFQYFCNTNLETIIFKYFSMLYSLILNYITYNMNV